MGLIKCPECKKEISSQSLCCPQCGFSRKKREKLWVKLVTPILYKIIPKQFIKIKRTNFILPFKEALYTYYTPRFNWPKLDRTSEFEFTTLNGDSNDVHFLTLPEGFSSESSAYKTIDEKLSAVLKIIKNTVLVKQLKNGEAKITNEQIFNNGFWDGAILEIISAEDKENILKEAFVVFGVANFYIALSTLVPKYSSEGLVPEDLYTENLNFLKSCHIPGDMLKKLQNAGVV